MGTSGVTGDATSSAESERKSYRLTVDIVAALADIAWGIEETDSGLKSSTFGDREAYTQGATRNGQPMVSRIEWVDDEDECFNRIGDYLAQGFRPSEIASIVRLSGGATKLLALERWCQRAGLRCLADIEPRTEHEVLPWRGSVPYERRLRARTAFRTLREAGDHAHAAVLHIVYGPPDPFLRTLDPGTRSALGPECAPLARYTDAVEAKRQELVRLEVARATDGDVVDIARVRSLRAWADRCVSSGDALRVASAHPPPRAEGVTPEHHRESVVKPHRAAQDRFLAAVRVDANRMLSDASRAFRAAWDGARR